MKSTFFTFSLFVVVSLLFSCSKKTAPVSSAPQPTTEKQSVAAAPAFTANATEGMKIYQGSCGRCHDLKATTEYTTSEWRPIMNSMAKKAGLSDTQKAHVLEYVLNNAKK